MAFITKSLVTKQSPVNVVSSRVTFTGNAPNAQDDEAFLRNYGQVSWVRAGISVIANAIAQTTWRLYRDRKDGEREEITGPHDLKDLWNHPNPFQTNHDFLYLHQVYDELLGRNYWVKQTNKGTKELWIMKPQYMSPIPDSIEYIKGYQYKQGSYEKTFDVNQVIYFIDPDPLDPMNGIGRAKSVGVDIDNQSYMSQYNRNFFYWNADPGTTISYPIEASITPDDIDRLMEQWNAGHRGYGRAHKAAILTQGASITKEGTTHKDMDYANLAKYNRESILGVFGVSYSMIGGTENIIRANAEAQMLNFATWVLVPRLSRIKQKINTDLVPEYGQDLEIDYDDPAPTDEASSLNKSSISYSKGIATLNEAREMIGLDPDDSPAGDEYFHPQPSPFGGSGDTTETPGQTTGAVKPVKSVTRDYESEANDICKARAKQAESFEPKAIAKLKEMFAQQRTEALNNLKSAISREHTLIDIESAKKVYTEAMTGITREVLTESMKNGLNGITPKNPHKDSPFTTLTQFALAWLNSRIEWAANEISLETENKLSDILRSGFEQGLGTDAIAQTISDTFDGYFSDVRSQRIARTEILSAANIGTIEGYKQLGATRIKIWAAEDERTCPLCQTLHDTTHDIDEGYVPPFHPNCLLPDVRVESPGLVMGQRALYDGNAIELTMEDGNNLTVTPNHMILTPNGFIPAKSLHEGNYVISCIDSQRISFSVDPYNNHSPTPIADKFTSLSMSQGMLTTSVPVAPIDFHGDAGSFNGNVDIIYPDGLLLNNVLNASQLKTFGEYRLCERHTNLLGLNSLRAQGLFSNRFMSSTSSDMSSHSHSLKFFWGGTGESLDIGLAPIARFNSNLNQSSTEDSTAYAELSREVQLRFAGLISPKQVVQVRNFNYTGHVYDLQTKEHWYIANNIITHNCRCTTLAEA